VTEELEVRVAKNFTTQMRLVDRLWPRGLRKDEVRCARITRPQQGGRARSLVKGWARPASGCGEYDTTSGCGEYDTTAIRPRVESG
jgi:hypothetical protein